MLRSVRFLQSIASAENWAYASGQVVRVGTAWTTDEIPAANAEAFLAGGLVEVVDRAPPAPDPVPTPTAPEFAVDPTPIETTAVVHRRPKRTR